MAKELVAMAPAGETYLSRDEEGVVRRHSRFGPGHPVEVAPAVVDWAVDRYGYDRVEQSFPTWKALDAFVKGRVPSSTVDPAELPLGPTMARMAPSVLQAWLEDPSKVELVPQVIGRLLGDDRVLADLELVGRLVSLLTDLARRGAAPWSGSLPLVVPAEIAPPEGFKNRRTEKVLSYFELVA